MNREQVYKTMWLDAHKNAKFPKIKTAPSGIWELNKTLKWCLSFYQFKYLKSVSLKFLVLMNKYVPYSSVAQCVESLQSHGLQHTRLPCPSLSPRVCANSCPLSWWCHPTISSCCFQIHTHSMQSPVTLEAWTKEGAVVPALERPVIYLEG